MKAEAENLLVPVFMIFDPIPETCLQRILNWFATTELCCKYSKLHVLCTRLYGYSKADPNCMMCQTALVYVKIDVEELRKFRKIYLQYLQY